MTKEEFAQLINNREYLSEISDEEIILAKKNGLVVVFGYSDDNVEFRGALTEEIGCYAAHRESGYDIQFTKYGVVPEWPDHETKTKEEADLFYSILKGPNKWMTVFFDKRGSDSAWVFDCNFPHAVFNIKENGTPYSKGIVFNLDEALSFRAK